MSSKTHNDESPVGGRDVDCDGVASRYRAAQLILKHAKTHSLKSFREAHLQIFRVSPSQLKIHFQSVPLLGYAY